MFILKHLQETPGSFRKGVWMLSLWKQLIENKEKIFSLPSIYEFADQVECNLCAEKCRKAMEVAISGLKSKIPWDDSELQAELTGAYTQAQQDYSTATAHISEKSRERGKATILEFYTPLSSEALEKNTSHINVLCEGARKAATSLALQRMQQEEKTAYNLVSDEAINLLVKHLRNVPLSASKRAEVMASVSNDIREHIKTPQVYNGNWRLGVGSNTAFLYLFILCVG